MNDQKLDPITLHALIDGELAPDEHAAALAATNADTMAGLQYTEYRRLKEAVSALPGVEIPPTAWKQCVQRLNEIDRSRKAERFVTRYAWGMAAGVFLLIVGAGSWNRLSGPHMGASDVSHMASLLSPLDRTENPQQVGKWLQDRVGPVSLNNLSVIPVVRAEAGRVDGKPVVRLILQEGNGPLALYIWRGDEAIDGFEPLHGGPLSRGQLFGENCVAWNQNRCHLVLAGRLDPADLERIAQGMSNGAVSIGAGN